METASVVTDLPLELAERARSHVETGASPDLDALVAEALQRYLDSHSPETEESLIREDLDWALHGTD
jgi:Arc/MetJ-type ribon-helix-helix transcriptional regulator